MPLPGSACLSTLPRIIKTVPQPPTSHTTSSPSHLTVGWSIERDPRRQKSKQQQHHRYDQRFLSRSRLPIINYSLGHTYGSPLRLFPGRRHIHVAGYHRLFFTPRHDFSLVLIISATNIIPSLLHLVDRFSSEHSESRTY